MNSRHSCYDSKAHFSDESMEGQVTDYVSPHQGFGKTLKQNPDLWRLHRTQASNVLGEVTMASWRGELSIEEGTTGTDQATTQDVVVKRREGYLGRTRAVWAV